MTLVETLLGLIRSANRQWRTFDQYWQLFNEVARLGNTATQMLVYLDLMDRSCDFFLGEASHLKEKYRSEVKYDSMGTLYQPANWGPFLYLLQRLTCSLKLPAPLRIGPGAKGSVGRFYRKQTSIPSEEVFKSQPPTLVDDGGFNWPLIDGKPGPATDESDCDGDSMDAAVFEFMTNGIPLFAKPEILVACLKFNQAPDAVVDILCHLSWENPGFVDEVLPRIAGGEGVQIASLAEFKAYELAYKKLIGLQDSLQMRRTHLLLGDPFHGTFLYGVGVGFEPKELPAELSSSEPEEEAAEEIDEAAGGGAGQESAEEAANPGKKEGEKEDEAAPAAAVDSAKKKELT